MSLLFVSTNKHKFEQLQVALKPFGVELKHREFEMVEFPSDSLEEIAVGKVRQAFEKFREPLIVDDTGMYFDAYKNFPGTDAKKMFIALNYDGIFRLLQGKSRKAEFKTVICYIDSPDNLKCFEASMKGEITEKVFKPKKRGLPYNRIFIPKGETDVLINLPLKKRALINQRGLAAAKFGKWLKEKALDELVESIE